MFFFVRVVTNLHLYLICLLNMVGCGFIFVFDLASECGWLWIYGPTWLLVSKWEASGFFSVTKCYKPTRLDLRSFQLSLFHSLFRKDKWSEEKKQAIFITFPYFKMSKTIEDWNFFSGEHFGCWSDMLVTFLEEHSSWIWNGLENLFSLCP